MSLQGNGAENQKKQQNSGELPGAQQPQGAPITEDQVRGLLGDSKDVVFRQLDLWNLSVTLIYIDGMIDAKSVSEYVIAPLLREPLVGAESERDLIGLLRSGSVVFASQNQRGALPEIIGDILSGNTALLLEGERVAFTFEAKGFEKRAVAEPTNENVIKGAKDAFVEVLPVNTALCRRKLRTHNLVVEHTVVGRQSQTKIGILYLKNVVNPDLVEEVRKRIGKIQLDQAIVTGAIEEFIADQPASVFPQILYTERVDRFCGNLAEGRVGLLIDGLPTALIVPATLFMFLQAPEDYSQNYLFASFTRFLRFVAFMLALELPAFYISITTFHHEMIPTELATSIASSKEGVPFPMFVEVIALLFAFELLLEAGLRLPKPIGQAMSIVGALIVGQAAVQARLLSPATVIVISITAVAGFVMPNQDLTVALRLWRVVLALMSSIIGFFGMGLGLVLILYNLCRIETFGVPYLDPFTGNDHRQMQDTLFRLPLRTMKKRPESLHTMNDNRIG